MLVLTQRPGETLLLGDQIEVHVMEVGRGTTKLAIKAPKEVSITRARRSVVHSQDGRAAGRPAERAAREGDGPPQNRRRRRVVIEPA